MTARDTALIVGTYKRRGGAGLVPLTLTADDRFELGAPLPHVANASFGVRALSGRFYLVNETEPGQIRALERTDASWQTVGRAASGGNAPCHLALDPDERLLAVANYQNGSVALFRLGANGDLPAAPTSQHQLYGCGPDPDRQKGPHAHWVGFSRDGDTLYAVDLGSDRILAFPVDAAAGALGPPTIAYSAPPGSGPRHLAFAHDGRHAFLVSELASTLTLLRVTGKRFEPVQIVSAMPEGAGESLGGAILLNAQGDRLYVTNRGHDSIAIFEVGGGALNLLGHVPSGGASPRFLLLLEQQRRLLVANEEGGSIRLFSVGEDGDLTVLATSRTDGAVFLARAD